jgi:WD40 repeat protein
VVTFTTNRALQFWNVSDHTLAHTMVPKTNLPTYFVEITPDTRIAIVKSSKSSNHLLDARTGDYLGMLELERTGLEDATPWQCSPDSRFVAVGTKRARDGQTAIATDLFDLNTRKRVVTMEDLRALRFSQKGRFLGGKTSARQLSLWDIERRTRRLFEISRGDIFSIAFSPDDRLMAASNDEMILIWNLQRPGPPMVLNGHNASVGKILFSRDGLTLFSTSTDRTVKMWNVATGVEVISLSGNEETWELVLSPDGTALAVGGLVLRPDVPPVKLWFAPSLKDIDPAFKAGSDQ